MPTTPVFRAVSWKFFLGSCLLTGALLSPHAGPVPIVAGMVLAGLIQLLWARFRAR
jgi:hypothetical protein